MAEKNHQPTAHKLLTARRRGEVAKSSDLISAVQYIALLVLLVSTADIGVRMFHSLIDAIGPVAAASDPGERLLPFIGMTARMLALLVLAVSALAGISATAAGLLQVGGLVAWVRLRPDISRLNPATGLKRMFSLRNLVDLAKMTLKTLLLGAVTFAVIRGSLGTVIQLGFTTPGQILSITGKLLAMLFGWAAVVYLGLAALDFAHQRWEYTRSLKMSTEEVRREYKDSEGDPHMSSRRKQMGRELAYNSMRDRLGAASVVVYSARVAVALYYAGPSTLPVLIERGEGEAAEKIREIAQELLRPTLANTRLAELLYEQVGVGQFIDRAHFREVARLLRWATGEES